MLIKMLKTTRGANDGVTIASYEAGETYDLSETLAGAFLADKVAEHADAKPATKSKPKTKPAAASKDAGAPPENKSE